MQNSQLPNLKAFLVCRDVLQNSRNTQVISIINIFNELRVNKFPAHVDSICLVAIYGGVPGEYVHHFEIFENDRLVGKTGEDKFFLEDRNAIFHVAAYVEGILVKKPMHLEIKSILNGITTGHTTLGIFKPFKPEEK